MLAVIFACIAVGALDNKGIKMFDFSLRISPIKDDKGEAILYDIFLNGDWYGSRRTKEQAASYIKHIRRQING